MNPIKKFILFSLVLTSFFSCSKLGEIKNDLKLMLSFQKEYGGSWNASKEENCFKISVENSKTLNNASENFGIIGTKISRKFIDSFGLKYTCLIMDVTQKKKSISHKTTYRFDLEMINRFKDLSIPEYLNIQKAMQCSFMADNNELDKGILLYQKLDSLGPNKPFTLLAKAHIERTKGNSENANAIINTLLKNNQDDVLYQYIGFYYIKSNELNKTLHILNKASKLNEKNLDYLLNIASLYQHLDKTDSSILTYNKAIHLDSTSLKAYSGRMLAYHKLEKFDSMCYDITKIQLLDPSMKVHQDLLDKCK